ncbi:hypothetical protein A2J04_01075 [Rhodococcus sp. EPR-279]|nr:hypothetical protein A2J02_00550 [Rhodococcus sp. EPR-147]KZF08447.1 hypothetical protein A2J04_01075 [Rhodococcus sp. EPR-279]
MSVALLGTMAAVATTQVLDLSNFGRGLAHAAILICAVAAVVYGVFRAARKPTWLLPRMALVFFTLGSVASLIGGSYLPAASGAIMAAILPMFSTDERWDRLFGYRAIAN